MLSHQIGGFLGSYIGGIVIYQFNDYGWMWYADAVLAGTAALLNLPIREKENGVNRLNKAKNKGLLKTEKPVSDDLFDYMHS